MDVAAGNLREERLKDEEIVAADQFDVDVAAGTPAQMLGGEHPAEAAADDDHPVPGLFRQWRGSDGFEKGAAGASCRTTPFAAQCASFFPPSRASLH
jgi:hypothetical protein